MAADDDLQTIMAGQLVITDRVDALATYLPELAPDDRERVDGYVARASSEATLRA